MTSGFPLSLRLLPGGLVLFDHARRNSPAIAHPNAAVFRPRADVTAALASRSRPGPGGPAGHSPAQLAGMAHEGSELLTESQGMLVAQIDLIVSAVEPESQGFIGMTAVNIVSQLDAYLLSHLLPPTLTTAVAHFPR